MSKKAWNNPRKFPRPYPMVVAILEYKTGKRLSIEGVRKIERRALAKMRAAMGELNTQNERNEYAGCSRTN